MLKGDNGPYLATQVEHVQGDQIAVLLWRANGAPKCIPDL